MFVEATGLASQSSTGIFKVILFICVDKRVLLRLGKLLGHLMVLETAEDGKSEESETEGQHQTEEGPLELVGQDQRSVDFIHR